MEKNISPCHCPRKHFPRLPRGLKAGNVIRLSTLVFKSFSEKPFEADNDCEYISSMVFPEIGAPFGYYYGSFKSFV
jgi:hypothetical protein